MATNYLDTGDTGRAVSAESDGALFAGIFGSAKYVLENGSQFKAEVQSNNIVKISDGDAVMYGRHVRIPANDSALVTINNGHAGTNRVDLIVFRYTKDSTGKETVDLVVIQGEDFTGTGYSTDGGGWKYTDRCNAVRLSSVYRGTEWNQHCKGESIVQCDR